MQVRGGPVHGCWISPVIPPVFATTKNACLLKSYIRIARYAAIRPAENLRVGPAGAPTAGAANRGPYQRVDVLFVAYASPCATRRPPRPAFARGGGSFAAPEI